MDTGRGNFWFHRTQEIAFLDAFLRFAIVYLIKMHNQDLTKNFHYSAEKWDHHDPTAPLLRGPWLTILGGPDYHRFY